ncbi:MAG: hypothetical protein LBB22_04230 [Treponema sp.]|jgi:hypothetical protein|nr:hypothetical protein [Treponema sp.]
MSDSYEKSESANVILEYRMVMLEKRMCSFENRIERGIEKLETQMEKMDDSIEQRKGLPGKFLWVVILALMVSLASIVIGLIAK